MLLNVAASLLSVRFQPVFSASCFHPVSLPYVFKQPALLPVKITSHLVEPVTVDLIGVSLLPSSVEATDESDGLVRGPLERQTSRSSEQSLASTGSAASASILDLYSRVQEVVRMSSQPVDLVEYVELESDRQTVSACGVMCQTVLQRVPTTPAPLKERAVARYGDWDLAFTASDCVLQPGDNIVQLAAWVSFSLTFIIFEKYLKIILKSCCKILSSFLKFGFEMSVV